MKIKRMAPSVRPDGTRLEKFSAERLASILQNLLDFIGAEGVVNEKFAYRRDQLCAALRNDISVLEGKIS